MGENKLDKFVLSYTIIWLNFILVKAGILKKQQEVRLLMRNKIYDNVTNFGHIKIEKCKYIEKQHFFFKYENWFIIHSFRTYTKKYFSGGDDL